MQGSMWYTFLDACAAFNRIANTDRARRMLAILARSGQYLPRCLTFGPHTGPEDFSYAVDRLFSPGLHSQRRFCKEWLAYADDLTVRTGRFVDGQALTDEAYDARIALAVRNSSSSSSAQDIRDALTEAGFSPGQALGAEALTSTPQKRVARAPPDVTSIPSPPS